MKALENAEKDNKQQHLDKQPPATAQHNSLSTEQQAAANIFQAALPNKSYFSTTILGLLGLVIICLLWFGFQFFQLNKRDSSVLMANDLPIKPLVNDHKPIQSVIAHQLEAPNKLAIDDENQTDINDSFADTKTILSSEGSQNLAVKESTNIRNNSKNQTQQETTISSASEDEKGVPTTDTTDAFPSDKTIIGEITSHDETHLQDDIADKKVDTLHFQTAHRQPAMAITKNQPLPRVDETLLSAYNALMAGNIVEAQTNYRKVLSKNIANIDALLGMATIAQKTSRHADAVGWYQKVLEIEPNNAFALAGIVNASPNTNHISQMSHLKNLIASQPTVASFHASLGNIYATQNQWPEAQAAYFEACRYAPDQAEYAFNLAISLEHLNKPKLALLQYQRALALVIASGAASPDRTLLSKRIAELE